MVYGMIFSAKKSSHTPFFTHSLLLLLSECTKALRSFFPGCEMRTLRQEGLCRRIASDGAYFLQVAQLTQAHQLHERVTLRRRFIGSGNHGDAERVSQPLVESRIARPSAQDVDLAHGCASRTAHLLKYFTIAQHETLHDAARESSRRLK